MHHSVLVLLLVVPLALPSPATAAVAGVSRFPGARPPHAKGGASFRQGYPRGGSHQYLLPAHSPSGPTDSHESLKNVPREVVDRIRGTLQALQALSDSQLWALLQDQPASDSDVQSSLMHLAASRQYLRQVDQQLERHSNSFHSSTLPSSSTAIRASPNEGKRSAGSAMVPEEVSDSLLMDLMQLSVYLEGNEVQPREDPDRGGYPPSPQGRGKGKQFIPSHTRKRSLHFSNGRIGLHSHVSTSRYGNQHWLRTETCPLTPDGRQMFFCPSLSMNGNWKCIDDEMLCDGVPNCPKNEDEYPLQCLFYTAVKAHIDDIVYQVIASNNS